MQQNKFNPLKLCQEKLKTPKRIQLSQNSQIWSPVQSRTDLITINIIKPIKKMDHLFLMMRATAVINAARLLYSKMYLALLNL